MTTPRRRAIAVHLFPSAMPVFNRNIPALMASNGNVDETIELLSDMATYLLDIGGSVELCDETGEPMVCVEVTPLAADASEIN